MLTPIQTLALSKAVDNRTLKEARVQVRPGRYTGTLSVELDYELDVGKDRKAPVRIPWKNIALALATRVNADTLTVVSRMATSGGKPAVTAQVQAWVDDMAERLDEGATAAGNVKAQVDARALVSARLSGGAA